MVQARPGDAMETPKTHDDSGSPPNFVGPTFMPMEEIEPFERYCTGGYYPVQIGDRFSSSRYEIVHKLGFGSSCTAWLARDYSAARYVAIKFLAASLITESTESELMRSLEHDKPAAEEHHRIDIPVLRLIDEFEIPGPKIHGLRGTHRCLVMTLAQCTVAQAREASLQRLFQPDVAKAIVAQLVEAVAFLHSRGIVHGDLHEANVFFRLPTSIDDLTVDQLYEKYGTPETEQAQRLDNEPIAAWVPKHGVVGIWMGEANEDITLPQARVVLGDLSESFNASTTQRFDAHAPIMLRPPEAFLDTSRPVSFAADVWALACTMFHILGQRALFESWFPHGDEALEGHVQTLGKLPSHWWCKWENRGKVFDEEGNRIDGGPRRTLEHRFERSIQEPRRKLNMEVMCEEEKQALLELLRSMLTFQPELRPSAEQVLQSAWMTRWALPTSRPVATMTMESMATSHLAE